MPTSGWLVLNKPLTLSSTFLLNRLKKYFPKKHKIGHAGTLDPLASGVLPVAVGEATKLIPYCQNATKTYRFEVTWGTQTTTDDLEGSPVHQSSYRPSQEEVLNCLPNLIGCIEQIPPLYSAIKLNGKRAYALAREGQTPDMPSRLIEVHSLALLSHSESTSLFEVTCGKGTYVRSLARDLGLRLSCYGYVSSLQRTRVGSFTLEAALDGNKLLETSKEIDIQSQLLPLGCVLDDIPETLVTEDQEKRLKNGQALFLPQINDIKSDVIACKRADMTLVAIGYLKEGQLHPKRVFNL